MAHVGADHKRISKALDAFNNEKFTEARSLFAACQPTAKVIFNLAIVELQLKNTIAAEKWLRQAVDLDPHLILASFYLGCLETHNGLYQQALDTFETCKALLTSRGGFVDYSAIGMPLVLRVEDAAFNISSLIGCLYSVRNDAYIASLSHLDLDGVRVQLDLEHDRQAGQLCIRQPPWLDKRMLFRLLPSIRPVRVELEGPEFIALCEGEEYTSGFEAADTRSSSLALLHRSRANRPHDSTALNEPEQSVSIAHGDQIQSLPLAELSLSAIRERLGPVWLATAAPAEPLIVHSDEILQILLQQNHRQFQTRPLQHMDTE